MSLRRIAPEAALIGAGQLVAALASLATIRAMTGILRPQAFGELALAFTVAGLAQQCLLGPISMAAVRYYPRCLQAGNLRSYFRGVLLLCAGGTILLAALTAAFSRWAPGLWTASAYAVLSSISALLDGVQNAARRRALVALHQGAGAWLRLFLALGLARLYGASAEITLWGYTAGYAVLIASQALFLRATLAGPLSASAAGPLRPIAAALAGYSWPFTAWGVFTWAQASADRWALTAYAGLYQTGLYQSLYQLGYYPAALMTQLLLQVATPVLFAKGAHSADAERWNRRLLHAALAATAAVTAFSAIGGHKLLALLLASDYRKQSVLLTPLILASGVFAAAQIAALQPMVAMNTRSLLAPKIVTAAGGAVLLVLGAWLAGTKGVVAAQLCFSVVYLVWILSLNRRSAFSPESAGKEPLCASCN